MKTPTVLFAALAFAATLASAPADAQSLTRDRGEQSSARAELQAGRILPIREIERRIIPQMRETDEYIGFEYDPEVPAYRLKFIRNGRMIWVDVDARSARVLRYSR